MWEDFLKAFDLELVLYAGAVTGILLTLEGVRQFLTREKRDEARSRRMKMIAKGATTEEILALWKKNEKKSLFHWLPLVGDLPMVLRQAGITMSSGSFLTTCVFGFLVVAVIFSQILAPVVAIAFAFFVCIVIPVMAVRLQRTQRTNDLVKQMPDALELMSRGLKVGHPLNTTIASVAREMPDPIGTEFGLIADQVAYGDDLADAFGEFADRMQQEDVEYLSTAISIQHGTGGDLARILSVLAKVIRDRMMMRRKIKAVSAEGRMSAAILSVVPVILFTGMNLLSPSYYGDVADEPLAKPIVFIVVVLVALNAIILRKLVTFRF